MENTMKKSYKISRMILAAIALIIFNILFINEDESWRIIPFIFAIIVFGFSFPSSIISRKLINVGNKIESKILKILYYALALPFLSIFISGGICLIIYLVYETLEVTLGQGIIFLFLIAIIFIAIILPYIQTLIVLILNHFIKNH